MLYSIVPPEVIFGLPPAAGTEAALREVPLARGGRLLLRRGTAGECVERVISTDPRDFLRPELQPGTPRQPDTLPWL
jgi:hypothetical protein